MIPLRDDNPTRRFTFVSYALIAACIATFLWQLSLEGRGLRASVRLLGLVPRALLGDGSAPAEGADVPAELSALPAEATILTSMFLHGGWGHLLFNMLFLWIFADNVEDRLGHGRFLLFYLLCGTVAALAHAIPNAGSPVPMVGASGAISGVLGAYVLLYPKARVLTLIPIFILLHVTYLPAVVFLGLWFAFQILHSMQAAAAEGGGGGVAYGAHIGGFVAGLALTPLLGGLRAGPRRG